MLTRLRPLNLSNTDSFTFGSLTTSGQIVIGTVAYANTDGQAGQVLTTYGNGQTYWSTVTSGSGNSISSGTSNVRIAEPNGNILISANGINNVFVVSGNSANLTGNLLVSGIVTASNANLGNLVTANFFAGALTTAAQPNITSVGTLTGLSVNGDITAANITANTGVFTGNGSGLTNLPGANVTGTVANANYAAFSGVAGSANSVAGANVSGTVANANYAAFSGVAGSANSVAGANVTGTVANATYATSAGTAGTVTTASQPNITSVGTLSSLSVTGNITAGNANLGNLVTANFFSGDGGLLTNISATTSGALANGNSNVNIPAANGNINLSASGNANVLVVTGTGINVTGNLVANSVQIGNGTGGNVSGVNVLTANTGNFSANLIAGGNLSVSGNAVIGGNLTVNGNLSYINVTDLSVSDPIIQLQTGPNGAAPTSNSGKDVGTALNYYDTSAKIAWMGWDTSNAEIAFGANVGISSEVVTFTSLANIRAGNAQLGNAVTANFFVGSGNNLSNIQGANVTGAVANATAATTAGTVTTAAQPNITSLGTLSNLTVTGNITSGNANLGNAASANFFIGNGSLLTGITAVSAASIANGNSNVTIPAANGNVNISVSGNSNVVVVTGTGVNVAGNMSVTGNISAGNFTTSGAPGNISGANVITACTFIGNTGNFSTALNVTGTSNLGPVGNVTITGGSNGQFLQTNGSGVLSWATVSTSSISNGNSNVNIPAANGNVNISAAGNANIVVVTGTGANIAGTLNVTGNANAGNIGATSGVFTTVAGSLTTAAQPNITSVGTLSSLAVTGNITSGNASLGNLVTANFFSGVLTTAAQPNITSIGTLGSLAVTGNITAGNANLGNAVTANFYIGNGSLLTGITVASVSNGNSNVNIPAANGNVNISAAGNANIVIVTGTGANITGSLGISSNLAVTGRSNLGAVGNVTITGGTANYVLSTDGAGNLSWVAQTGGGGGGTPGGTNTQVQFNDANSFAGNAGFTFNKTTTTVTANNFVATSTANLGAVGNVTITGGSSGLVLTTNGSGGLSWGNVGTAVTVDSFIGSGSQTAFTLSTIPASVNYTLVSLAGTFQPRDAYTLAGNVLTFTSAPPAASPIEVTTLAAATYAGPNTGTFINRTYTGDGANVNYTVTNGVTANSVIVTENGIVQAPGTDYTVSGANLTFTSAPANSVVIGIREIPAATGGGSTWANASANVTASANTKYILNTASTAITVTLPTPSFGMEVGIIDGTGNANVNNINVFGNGANIQGSNANMTVNTSRAAFTLVYYNSAQGWLLTNV